MKTLGTIKSIGNSENNQVQSRSALEMSHENTPPVQTPDAEMVDAVAAVAAEPDVDEQELLHQKRLELLKSLDVTPTYNWKYLTDELIENLDSKIPELITTATATLNEADDLFYEVLYSARYYNDRISIEKLATILDSAFETKNQEFPYRFLSIFNNFNLDDHIIDLLKSLDKLPSKDIASYLADDKLLIRLNIIKDYQKNKTDHILGNYVEQKKYNLLMESSEGFAKVALLLFEAIDSEYSAFQIDYTVNAIDRLIGHFSLDPIRVLDVILDIFTNTILSNYRFCIDFLRKSQWWPKNNESDNSSLETLNKGGNKEAALLLGIKLKQYHDALSKDVPETFKILISILIKEGFISFGDVVKYLAPDDKVMNALEEQIKKNIDDEIFKASASALALSGPLADDEDDSAKKDGSKAKSTLSNNSKENTEQKLKTLNQKLQMTKSFLTVGLYWPSIYMLTKYPYLVHADSDFIPLILKLFNVMVEPLKKKVCPLNAEETKELRTEKPTPFSRRTTANDAVEFEEYIYNHVELLRPLHHDHTNRKFHFFYHEWSTGLPSITTTEELFKCSAELLSFVGAKIGETPELITLLSRIGVDDLNTAEGSENYEEKLNLWFEYFRKYIFPASTALTENSITTYDIFELLKKFPLQKRYNLYGDMVNNISKNNNIVRLNYSKAEKQTKDVLKRITTENVKPMMRRFAKIAFANPIPSFLVIVTQVESYDNLSNLMVEAARYFTDYAWDVLPFVLLMRLTARRNFIQSDGMNEAQWLQSLATFIAKLGKNYAPMNLTPILTFIIKDLHKSNTIGLTILREIVNQMGGIQQSSNLSANQIKLLNSGESLQRSINKVIFDTREECVKPALRLLSHLINSNQLSELFILLCRFHSELIERSDDFAHYKILSNQSDEITSVLHTYIELINYFLRNDTELFKKNVIDLSELVTKYGVEVSWAFELWRKNVSLEIADQIEYADVDFETLNKDLYTSFWKLSLYDINYDKSLYDHEEQRLKDANTSIVDHLERLRKERFTLEVETKELKLKKEKRFNDEVLAKIPEDDEAHKTHSEEILKNIEERLGNWVNEENPSTEEIQAFYQSCVVPRAIHSETDAIFTGKFITSLLKVDVSQKFVDLFLTSEVLDTLIYTITPLEAENLGFFLAEIFRFYEDVRNSEGLSNEVKEVIYKWHTNALSSIKLNIESENYMSRRNAFTLLKNLIDVYPIVEDHAEQIVESIEKVSNSEERKDLKLASDAILAHIKSRSKKWIHLWDFYYFPEEEKEKVIEKRNLLLKERENKILEAKRAELLRQKAQRDAEIASRAQSRAQSRAESRPESRSSIRPEGEAEIRLRPRLQEVKDEDGDVTMAGDSDSEAKVKTESAGKSTSSNVISDSKPAVKDAGSSAIESKVDDEGKVDDENIEKDNMTKLKVEEKEEEKKEEKNEEKESVTIKKDEEEEEEEGVKAKKEIELNEKKEEKESIKEEEAESEQLDKMTIKSEFAESTPEEKQSRENGERPQVKEEKGRLLPSSKNVDTYIPGSASTEKSTSTGNDRPKRIFKDVTASTPSPNHDNLQEKIRKIQDAVEQGSLSKLLDAVKDDELYVGKINDASKNSKRFRTDLKNILISYINQIIPRSHPMHVTSVKRIQYVLERHPPPSRDPESRPTGPGVKSRVPLPPQQAVSGFTNKPNDKWGMDSRAMQLPSGPSSQTSTPARPYGQGYRQPSRQNTSMPTSSGSGRLVPPPPPPFPPPSRDLNAGSKRDSYSSDMSRTRSSGDHGYRDKRQRRA
ncbi:unnamed protein product [Wickerhamomyces anomalus]